VRRRAGDPSQVPGRGVTRRHDLGCSSRGELAGLLSVFVVSLLLFEDRFQRVVAELAAANEPFVVVRLRLRRRARPRAQHHGAQHLAGTRLSVLENLPRKATR
jgi:hypothetical protein